MKTKVIIFFISLLVSHIIIAQNNWEIINPPVVEDFVSLCFIDQSHGWIVSETGTIISTTDAGITWSATSFPDYNFRSVHFSDNAHGCIAGWQELPADSSLILLTNDGGETWSGIEHNRVNRLNDVFLVSNDIGWAVGGKGATNTNCCYYTSNGGLDWTYQSMILVSGAELLGVSFRNENIGSVCGTDGAFFITNNGGTTNWAVGISMPILNLNDIFNFGMFYGCIVGDEGTSLFTTNNWTQHVEQTTNTDENLNAVSGDPATNKLWAVGDNGTILYSSNYLLGWIMQFSGVTENLNDICMLNENSGWAVGDNGTILHYTGVLGVQGKNLSINTVIYPNPTKDKIIIGFPQMIFLQSLKVEKLNGQIIIDQKIGRQCTFYEFDISLLERDVYILKIFMNDELKVEKIVIY